jgi:hypothetical protein
MAAAANTAASTATRAVPNTTNLRLRIDPPEGSAGWVLAASAADHRPRIT